MELIRVARTCSKARTAAAGYQAAAFCIDRFLAFFFTSIPYARKFRSLQARTGTLIGGHSALHFLDRSPAPLHVLELYAFFQHRHEVGEWLRDVGYSYAPSSRQNEDYLATITDVAFLSDNFYWPPSVCGVMAFTKVLPDLTKAEVRVSFAMRNPMEIALESSSSTCIRTQYELPANSLVDHTAMLLNVITYNNAYSLYPRATLHERRTLILYDDSGIELVCLEDTTTFKTLGFDALEELDAGEFTKQNHASSFPLGWRSPYDLQTWRLPLPTIGVTSLPSHDPLSICSFLLRYSVAAMTTVAFQLMSSASLKYDYIIADKELSHDLQAELVKVSPAWDGLW